MEQHNNTRAQLEFTDRTLPLEITAELMLPDYRSEISRLLWVRPTLLPPERFIGNGKAELSGTGRFEILYVGPDGNLYGTEADSDYAFTLPLDGMSDPGISAIELCVEPVVDAVVSRVMGPRKLSVRCRMHTRVRGYASKELTAHIEGEKPDSDQICRLCDMTENGRFIGGGKEALSLSDTVDTEGNIRFIGAHGSVFLPEVTAARGEVRCKGEAEIVLLLCREEEGAIPFTVTRRIPFAQSIPMEDVTPDQQACAAGTLSEIHVGVEENGLALTAQLILTAQAQGEEPILLEKDLFLPGSNAECHLSQEDFWRAISCENRNFSISGERAMGDLGIGNEAELIDITSEAEIKEKVPDGARYAVIGELHCHVLYRRAGEYGVAEFPIPFRVQLESGCEDMSIGATVCGCRMEPGRDALRIHAELQLAIRSTSPAPVSVLSEALLTPATESTVGADPEIYYPAPGETLWNVAKRYAIAPDTLAAANGLSGDNPNAPDSLGGKRFILVS